MTKLSKEYESTIKYPVYYENLPKDKLLQKDPIKEIEIHVKTTGFKILSENFFSNRIKIDGANLYSKSNTNYFLLLPQQRLSIQRQMSNGVNLDHFIKDSISFNLGLLERKKLPVKLNASLFYSPGYNIEGTMIVKPDSIEITGPESVLDTIHFVETKAFVGRDVKESIDQELLLKTFSKENNVNLETKKVNLKAKVEKYTEGTIDVSFVISNLPEFFSIITYPKQVKLTYKVALSNFSQVNASSFVVECDYQMSIDNNLSYLVPKIRIKPNFVKSVKISPNKIDFVKEK